MRSLGAFVLALSVSLSFSAGAVSAEPADPQAPAPQDQPSQIAAADPAQNPSAPQALAQPNLGTQDDVNDPLEDMNRAFFRSNLALDHAFFRPVAEGYRYVVPHGLRNSIRNFLNNLDSPPIFVNEVLQGEIGDAANTVLRFAINSTVGVGGLFEVADGLGLQRHTEDFGQTLGTYGVGEGPYLFLPLIGPAPPRDFTGRVVDYFFDPLSYVHMGSNNYLRYARVTLDAVDLRERNIETLDEIERTSVDYYASVRSLYRQTRNNEINNGQTNIKNLPNF